MITKIHQPLTRIALFYDGNFFMSASYFFYKQHHKKAHLTFTGFQEYVRRKVAEKERREVAFCQIVEAHFFRGRFSLNAAKEKDALEKDRFVDQLLMHAGIVTHYYPMGESLIRPQEKGIDVWLALEAYDLAVHKPFDVLVLCSGDQDFVPLVRKMNGIGVRVMVVGMDVKWEYEGKKYNILTAQTLLSEASYKVILNEEVGSETSKADPHTDGLFQK